VNGTQIVKILKKAREKVSQGWIQGRSQNALGTQVCAAYAITQSVRVENGISRWSSTLEEQDLINDQTEIVGQLLLAAATEQTDLAWFSIPAWNDYSSRTQTEVLDTFDHAIKTAERDMEDAS
jgi:hypothetical protein